jgi:hypothetical protein
MGYCLEGRGWIRGRWVERHGERRRRSSRAQLIRYLQLGSWGGIMGRLQCKTAAYSDYKPAPPPLVKRRFH